MPLITENSRECAITGARGYLGSKLAAAFSDAGWLVYRLTRDGNNDGDALSVRFILDETPPAEFFQQHRIEVLVHCAYDFRPVTWCEIEAINVQGSIRLLEAAKTAGVKRIIFISTVSAFAGCKSLYGKAKLEIEKAAAALGAIVIRPGLIYGEKPGAMMGALTRAVKSLPVVPLIGSGNQPLYLVHEDDLVKLILKLCDDPRTDYPTPIFAASPNGLTLRGILTVLARRAKKTVRFIPLPWRMCWAMLKTFEAVGLKAGFRSDSILSLVNTDPDLKSELTAQTELSFRDFSAEG